MSVEKDYKKIAAAGLRNLYLQIADFYTESIKSGLEVSENILDYFNVELDSGQPDYAFSLGKSEGAVERFVKENLEMEETTKPGAFKTIESTTSVLIAQYDYFGITPPPEGFLQIDYDVKEWWKFRTRLQNGYFIFTEVFNYDDGKITKSGFDSGNPFPFDPKSASTEITGKLKNYLIDQTKDAYVEYANQNAFSKIVAPEQMYEVYFFFLDEGKNSLKFVADANGRTGKVYIRTFFNEFGQKLISSLTEIQGVEELKKVPGGIRKNYIVSSLLAGIDAFDKESKKDGPPTPKILEIITGLKEVKRLVSQMVEVGVITNSSTIGFVFTEDYEFLAFLDSENKSLNNFELYRFLKDKKDLNQEIIRLNYYACKFVGKKPSNQSIPVGNSAGDYQHFTSGGSSYKNETPEQKAANYKASRSIPQFIGDASLRIIFEELRKYVPTEVIDIYENLLHRVDITKLAEIYATLQSAKLTIPDLRKTYFRVFVESLDITEIVDCVVENAGKPQAKKEVIYPPILDGSPAITVTSQSSKSFELDLKIILYGKFAYFYNIAKGFDPDLFDFPSTEDNLPDVSALVKNLKEKSDLLPPLRAEVDKLRKERDQLRSQIKEAEKEKKFNLASQLTDTLFAKIDELNEAGELLDAAEQAFIDAQAALEKDQNKNFMYILMIPPSQTSQIYNVITTNDPQYKYKSDLINAGMLEARDAAGFTPETFIPVLFKNEILKYVNGLDSGEFQDLYDNIAKENKSLKTSAELKKDQENGLSQESIGKSAKTSQVTLPKQMTFDAFRLRYPTFSLDAAFAPLIKAAYDEAMKSALGPLVNAAKTSMDKSFNGDEDSFDRLDPDLKAEYTSNDLVQNSLDGVLSGFASPLEVYLKAQADVFPTNSIEEIQCLFSKIHSEIPIQLQLKLLSNTLDEEDTSIAIVKEVFLGCGLNNDFTTITNFFIWLKDVLGSTGGLDLLLQKIEDAREASLINTDLCDDNFEFLDELLASNDSREATNALAEVLGLLNDSKRNSLMPNIFGCSDNTGKASVFPDFYNEATRDSMNKLTKGTIDTINQVFNNDISQFKSIILKQNKTSQDFLTSLFGGDKDSQKDKLRDFLSNVDSMLGGNDNPSDSVKNQYKSEQTNLKEILLNVFTVSNPELTEINSVDGLLIYRFSFSSSYVYEIVTNTNPPNLFNEGTIDYLGETLKASSTYLIFSKITEDEQTVVFIEKISDSTYNFTVLYEQLLNTANPLILSGDKNRLLFDYPDLTEDQAKNFYSQRLLDFLYGNTEETPDFASANLVLVETILDSILLSFIESAALFDNKNFSNIPLKDNENPDYSDGGVLLSDEIFKNYKDLRKKYQCFLNFDSNPDANQASNLKALYKLLLNCLVIEGLMKQFFSLGLEQLSSASNDVIKKSVLIGIEESFRLSTARIGDLQQDYNSDVDFLYKLEVLEEKQAAQQNNANLTEENPGPPEWRYTETSDKINYLASEYYDKIINRLKRRIELSVGPGFEIPIQDIQATTNIINKAPNGNIAFEMYDDVDEVDFGSIPILNGLKKGLILQNYIDVRQNGSIIKDFVNGTLPGNSNGAFGSYSVAIDLRAEYLPLINTISRTLYTGASFSQANFSNESITPGYTNLFFTSNTSENEKTATAAPRININPPSNQTDRDSSNGLATVVNMANVKWFNNFYQTQGKISKQSFIDSYSKSIGGDVTSQKDYLTKNGPAVYYKKAAAGTRLCIVLPANDYPELKTMFYSFYGTGIDVKTREVYKEKIGLYRNENDEEFIVIPLITDETDYLQSQQTSWEQQNIINEGGILEPQEWKWWENLYNNLSNHTFTSDVLQSFESIYPASKTFAQALPVTIQSLMELEYGDQLSNMFNLTKEEILRAIKILKAVSNGEWDLNAEEMLGPNGILDMEMYSAIAFSLVPILVQLLATFTDPTWNTPWFLPGPITPVGYAAKILAAVE